VEAIERDGADLILAVHVQPRSSRDEVAGLHGDRLKVRITAPPVDGKANEHLIGYLAGLFRVPRRNVRLLAGETGRDKRFRIVAPKEWPACLPGLDRIGAGSARAAPR
jgi:uncharacterized protein (TIGR00251 family)